jgi:hypothetical protein
MNNVLKNGLRVLKNPSASDVARVAHDEMKRLEAAIPQMTPTIPASISPIAVGGSTSSSGGSPVSSSNDKAGSVMITSVIDQFIPFSSVIPVSYVLTVFAFDNKGAFFGVPVAQVDWMANGFWLRKALIAIYPPDTTSAVLFFSAKGKQ